ncbi:LOW QUALITY PROTEIN: titin-like [Daphnia magna]|uniref:LOW QUALITY PROTEIN: titin-like n=1 Tax=Daphnia magna TaxID=35525 RepID=UPI001E1B9FA2|nr:LOW QUALITY PROTEIN: titin-like [Daphnia magna]
MESKLPDLESLLVAPEQSPETTDPIPEVAEVESIQSEPSQVTESTLPNSENLSETLQESAQNIEASDVIPPVAGIESIQSEPTQTVESTLPNSENMVVATEQPLQTTEASDAIPKVESIQNESSQVTESKLPDLENLLVALEQSPEKTEASDSIPEVAEHQSIQGEPSQVMDECNLVPAEALTEPVELDLQLENESIVQSETIEDIVQQVDEPPKEPVESKHPSVLSWASVVATSKPAITESKEEVVEEPVRPKRPLPTLIVVGDGEQPVPIETDPDSFTEFVCRNERRRRKWRSSQSESQDYTTDEEHVESVSLVVDDKPKEQLVDSEPVEAPVQAPVTSAPIKLVENVSDEEVHDVLPATSKGTESLELADVIEHGETTPQLYYDLFADSWPHPFYIFLRDAESRWKAKESLVNQSVVTNVQEPIQEASQLVPQETVCEPQEQVDCHPNQEPTPELIPESVQEWVPAPSALQEEASSCPSAEVLQPTTDETPVISGWVIRESPEKKVPEVAKPLSWAAMVALSKAAAMETVPEPVVEQVAPRPTKTPVLVVVGEDVQPEPISSDDPDGFHECVSRREKRRRKWRSSQSESQDAEAEAVVPEASLPTDLPSEPSYVNVKVENVSTHPPELHEKSESKSKRVVVKIEKQTKEVERKRSKRLSESEREALQLAEAIESGQDITNKCPVVESYWSDKILYSDAEKLWQESLNGAAVRLDDKIESLKQSQSPESDPIPQPPPSVESSNSSSRLPTTTENINNIDLPEDRAIWSDESTFLSESQEERQQNVHKKDLSTDLDAMLAQLQQVEKDLQQFNSQQIQDRLPLIEAVMESLEEMEPRLIDLDDRIKNLSDEDPELDSIRAAVASLRTRHITLESQACRYKQKLEDAAEAKSKDNEDLLRYQALLSDLDDWVSVTHGQLKAELPKFTSVGAVLKEMDSSKDIVKRNEQLADLMNRCGTLQHSVAETEPLATQLYEHLCVLQRSFSEAGAQLHTRLLLLQACLLELEEKEVCVDISPPLVQHVDHEAANETPVTAIDTPVATTAPEVRLNDPIEHNIIPAQTSSIDDDNEMSFTQSVVQKTVRVIRRTILQNGREISVEEQIEENPTSGVTPLSVETELIPPKRYFRIPSPFGIVEEPNFHDDQQTEKDDNKSTVEITDITDEYDDREAANIGPSPDQFIEIHEVLDNLQFVEQPQSPEKIIELSSSNDGVAPQNQPRIAFETLHEHEEEHEHDESTEFNPVDTKADDDDEIQHGKELPETEHDLVLQESEISQTVEMLIEPQGEPILEANLQKDLDTKTSHDPSLGSEVQPEPEVTSEFQKLDEIHSELQTNAQLEPLVVCEEAAKQQVETSTVTENERTVEPKIEHELRDEVQQTEIEIPPQVMTEEQTTEPITENLVEEPNETTGEPESASATEEKPLVEMSEGETLAKDEAAVDHREVQAAEPTNQDDGFPIETTPDSREEFIEESIDEPIGEPDSKWSEEEIFEKDEATIDHQEKQAIEPTKLDDEIEKSPDGHECPIIEVELTSVSSTKLPSVIAEIPFDEPQQLQIPENQFKTEPESESKVSMAAEQKIAAAEPVKDELQLPMSSDKTNEKVPEKAMENVKTTLSSTTSSVGDETESDVDNMDWNVSPDDERQFDEYFKDERPPSASSNSSTSTDTTRLESASCEPVEDIPLQGIDTVDSSRATPIQEEPVPSDIAIVEEISNNQTANEDVQENLDSPVEVLVLEDSSARVVVDDVLQKTVEEEEQTSVVDESVVQVLDPIYVVDTEDESATESIVDSDDKMPTDLAEQLSQQLVEEVFKSVETHPTIERMIQESLIQSALANPSSSSESSSSQDDGGWWMVDPDDAKQEVKEPFEMVGELQSSLIEPTESSGQDEDMVQQQLDDNDPSTTSESQLVDVESLIVQLEPDLLQIPDLTKTESWSNVTVIRVGYGDELPVEDRQAAGTSFIEPLEKSEQDTLKKEAEVQQAIETLSCEPTKDAEQEVLDKEAEQQKTTGTPLIEPFKVPEQDTLKEEVEEQQTSGNRGRGIS